MTKEILVLGATGKTGRRLLPLLRDRGAAVRAASRSGGAGTVAFDWALETSWKPALEGVAAIYLVGPDLVEDPSDATAAFLDVAYRSGVRTVVALSSLGVTFPNEPIHSGRRKAEEALRQSRMNWTILRPSGFSQNFSEGFFAPGIGSGQVRAATGTGRVAFVDASDIASVAAVALTAPGHAGQAYALTGPRALSFDEATSLVAGALGRPVAFSPLGETEFRGMMLGFGLPGAYADVVVRDQVAIRDGFAADVSHDVEAVTGRPATDFSVFVDREISPQR